MAAKKAPMRKMVAPKPTTRKAPVKKAVAKKVASAADFRMKEEADKKKANLSRVTSNKPSIYGPGVARPGVDTGGNSNKSRLGGVRTEGGKVKADKYGSYYPKTTKNTPKKKK